MHLVRGKLLVKKSFTSKKGTPIPTIQILSQSQTFAKVIEIVDFDNQVNGTELGTTIQLPVRISARTSERTGRSYLNYVVDGKPEVMKSV
jgi:hypothetical protein